MGEGDRRLCFFDLWDFDLWDFDLEDFDFDFL